MHLSYTVYNDFKTFDFSNGAVYVRDPTASRAGGHAVKLIGWGKFTKEDGTTGDYWLCANSWGTIWGDKGFFKIAVEPGVVGYTIGACTPNTDSLK
jgi:C1A family cysteine protease